MALTRKEQVNLSSEKALERLKEGNKRFVENRMEHKNYSEEIALTSEVQHPFAVVLGCIDSRVGSEILFDQGIGDIFNVRIAGNFVNEDILASIEYSCRVVGAKVILVLGHTGCGAIKSTCDDVHLGHITGMLQKLKPALDSVQGDWDDRSSANAAFVQQVADANVLKSMEDIRTKSPILNEMVENGEVLIAGAMYDVASGRVTFY